MPVCMRRIRPLRNNHMSETSTSSHALARSPDLNWRKVPTPPSTATHVPIPHAAVVEALVDTLSHRQISVVNEEFAVSKDGLEMFGILDPATGFEQLCAQARQSQLATVDIFAKMPSGLNRFRIRNIQKQSLSPVGRGEPDVTVLVSPKDAHRIRAENSP